MIELKTTKKMLKVRNAMGYTYPTYPGDEFQGNTHSIFKEHGIKLTKRWSDADDTNIWSLEFPNENAEFLFRIKYGHIL